ncbi:hypothetical protein D3C77_288700 [compost metagenome]
MKNKHNNLANRFSTIAKLFFKEQINEPIAILWTIISPCIFFYFMTLTTNTPRSFSNDYITTSSWFFSYIASSTALFGCSFYLIGRRESGFVRSFIYQRSSIALYLSAHITGYSIIAICYGTLFYFLTRPTYGDYSPIEFLNLLLRFFICYTYFSSAGLLIALLPIKFSTASTLFSITSFAMLSLSYLNAAPDNPIATLNSLNPLMLAQSFISEPEHLFEAMLGAPVLLLLSSFTLYKYLPIQPVWSRY